MGTNFYLHQKPDCECCGREFKPLHIGKSSGGYANEADFHAENHSQRGPNGLLRHRLDDRNCVAHGEGTWDCIRGEFW